MQQKNRTWLEISKKNLKANYKNLKKLAGRNVMVACVVKSNAYGHGLDHVVSVLKTEADWFVLESVKEAIQVRKMTNKPILILGYSLFDELKDAIENDISITVLNESTLRRIISLNLDKKAKVHIKIETGFNRLGVKKDLLLKLIGLILKNEDKIILEGLFTHYANADESKSKDFVSKQLERFNLAVEEVKKKGVSPKFLHTAASSSLLLYPESRFNMVRVGVMLYGLWPSDYVRSKFTKKPILKPVLTWKSIIAQVKQVSKGDSVGYGRTWFAKRKTKIGVVPVGYADGYDRGLSNKAKVIVKDKKVSVIGRVSMGMITIDLSSVKKVRLEEEIILLGKKDKNEISANSLGQMLDTINYEILTRIDRSLPRIVV